MNVGVFIYAIMNTKNIKFKNWIEDIMSGYKIEKNFHLASIFILKNRFYTEKQKLNLSSSETSENTINSSLYQSIEPDYEVTDEYMKYYKINFVSDKSSK